MRTNQSRTPDPDHPKKRRRDGKQPLSASNTLSSSGRTGSDGTSAEEADAVNVVVRVRPLSTHEKKRDEKNIIQFPGDGAVWLDLGSSQKSFTFNVMFEPEASQTDVFENCGMKKLIDMALNGYACTAFAFGQTGSGKTHTITGPPELFLESNNWPNPDLHGLIPRSFQYLFHLMKKKAPHSCRVRASFLEIYNEQVQDLLNPSQKKPLAVRWSKDSGFYVENLFSIESETMEDLMAVLEEAKYEEALGCTHCTFDRGNRVKCQPERMPAPLTDNQRPKFISRGIRTNSEKTLRWVIERGKKSTTPSPFPKRHLAGKEERGVVGGASSVRSCDSELTWNDCQRRSYKSLMDESQPKRVDATYFMINHPSHANYTQKRATFDPKKPKQIPIVPKLPLQASAISRKTYSVSSSVSLTHSSIESDTESISTENRQKALLQSNSRVNTIRDLIHEEYDKMNANSNKEVTINLVVRPGSHSKQNGNLVTEPISLPEISPKDRARTTHSFHNLTTPPPSDLDLDSGVHSNKDGGDYQHSLRQTHDHSDQPGELNELRKRSLPKDYGYNKGYNNTQPTKTNIFRYSSQNSDDAYVRRVQRPQTPEFLKPLSAKHFLRQRQTHPQQSPKLAPLFPPSPLPAIPPSQKNVSTLTGELQYLIRNPHKRFQEPSSHGTSSLGRYGKIPSIMSPSSQPTQRVMHSTAQTDPEGTEEGADDVKEKGNQTSEKDAEIPNKDFCVQMMPEDVEISKDISTQVDSEDLVLSKEIETQVDADDLLRIKDMCTQYSEEDFPVGPITTATQTNKSFESPRNSNNNNNGSPDVERDSFFSINQKITSTNHSAVNHNQDTSHGHNNAQILQVDTNPLQPKTTSSSGADSLKRAAYPDPDRLEEAWNEPYPWETATNFEEYFMYLRMDSGEVIGPLKIDINETTFGLPEAEESADDNGLKNRAVGSNSQNEHSSRSHSMLTLNIDSEVADPDDENLYITKHGKLTFVDLAGSEKTKSGGNDSLPTAEHMAESNNINRSLLVLGNCISALGDSKKRNGHIPYRDSKLTKLLADSLGGQGVTLMIACVAPSSINANETMNTLRYAKRARKIKTKPVIKMDPREKLIMSLKREVKILRTENHYLRQQLEFPVKPRGQLQKENDEKFLQMLKEQKRDGKVTDHGLYEMLQEYMIENEYLRSENSDLHQIRDKTRREQQVLARENERLMRRVETDRDRVMTPVSLYSMGSSTARSAIEQQQQQVQQQQEQAFVNVNGYHNESRRETQNSSQIRKSIPQGPKRPPHRLNGSISSRGNPSVYIDPKLNGYGPRNQIKSQYEQANSPVERPRRATEPSYQPQNANQLYEQPQYDPQAQYYDGYSPGRGGYSREYAPPMVNPPPPPQIQHQLSHQMSVPQQHQIPVPQPAPTQQPSMDKKAYPKKAKMISAPVPTPRKTGGKGAPTSVHENPALVSIHSDPERTPPGGESARQLHDRLRDELVSLEGQIKYQSRLNTTNKSTKPGAAR